MGPSGLFRVTVRAVKVTTFYKTGVFSVSRAAIFGFFGDGFQGRQDGHFFARDGHYDSNDHRERENDGFRAAVTLPFSPPPSPRRAYRQNTEGQKALARRLNTGNVYLCNIRKIFTMPVGWLSALPLAPIHTVCYTSGLPLAASRPDKAPSTHHGRTRSKRRLARDRFSPLWKVPLYAETLERSVGRILMGMAPMGYFFFLNKPFTLPKAPLAASPILLAVPLTPSFCTSAALGTWVDTPGTAALALALGG